MILRVFIALIVIVAIVVGLLNITPLHTDVIRLAMFGEFFSAALPILAFGALVKYLCQCPGGSCKCCGTGASCKTGCKCCNGDGCKCCGTNKPCP